MNGDKRTAGGPKWTKMSKKTNEQKQKEKALASTVAPETARHTIKKPQPNLSSDEIIAIDGFENRLDKKLGELKKQYRLTNDDMYDLLAPYLSGANIMSKICPRGESTNSDRRHVNLLLMAAMRRVFGVSIDELLDECFQSLPDRQPLQK